MSARRVCLFDLDDTLYRSDRIHLTVRDNIENYIKKQLNVPAETVEKLTSDLYFKYGTTLAGLAASGYKIDYDDWHQSVHYGAIDYEKELQPDHELRKILLGIHLPLYVFTNADVTHAERCLERLGIRDCFECVFDFESVMAAAEEQGLLTTERPVLCKPMVEAYEVVLRSIGVSAEEAYFADDSARNVTVAHDLGMCSVFVGKDKLPEGARGHVAVQTLHELPLVLPQLLVTRRSGSVSRRAAADVPLEHVESGVPIEVRV